MNWIKKLFQGFVIEPHENATVPAELHSNAASQNERFTEADCERVSLARILENDRECVDVGSLRALIENEANVNERTKKGTVLHLAVKYCSKAVVELLIDSGASVYSVGPDGTAVNIAMEREDWFSVTMILLDKNCNPAMRSGPGKQSIYHQLVLKSNDTAQEEHIIAMGERLVAMGVRPNSRNGRGQYPRDLALELKLYNLFTLWLEENDGRVTVETTELIIPHHPDVSHLPEWHAAYCGSCHANVALPDDFSTRELSKVICRHCKSQFSTIYYDTRRTGPDCNLAGD